jgi:hypothetical protein
MYDEPPPSFAVRTSCRYCKSASGRPFGPPSSLVPVTSGDGSSLWNCKKDVLKTYDKGRWTRHLPLLPKMEDSPVSLEILGQLSHFESTQSGQIRSALRTLTHCNHPPHYDKPPATRWNGNTSRLPNSCSEVSR